MKIDISTTVYDISKIDQVLALYPHSAVLLVSPELFNDEHAFTKRRFVINNDKTGCFTTPDGVMGTYWGHRVFVDPNLKDGEVEIR